MFSENRPYRFQFDLTDKCNAACPMCARTLPMDFCRTDLTKVDFVELNFEDFEANFPQKLCDRTEQVSFGGTLGYSRRFDETFTVAEGEIDLIVLIILSPFIGHQLDPGLAPSLGLQVFPCPLV